MLGQFSRKLQLSQASRFQFLTKKNFSVVMASHGVPTTLRAFLTLSPLPYRHSFNQRETKQSLFAHRSSESEHPMHREGEELGKIYQKKSPAEHVLLRPDTYIGTTQFVDHEHWVFNESEKRMQKKACRYVPGLYKIFDEILVNANDNRQRDSKMSTIKVDIDPVQGLIEIENDGKGIPVALHPTENCYIPELVLGNLLTGSNFDDTIAKITGGRNGYGAKLTNIFSLLFTVETYDSQRGLHYVQTWKNNMTERGNPIITQVRDKKKKDFTKISFIPDLQKFKMKSLKEGNIIEIIKTRVFDVAGCNEGLQVILNGQQLPSKFQSYVSLFTNSSSVGSEGEGEEDLSEPLFLKVSDRWQIAIAMSNTHQFEQVSFVNGINTLKGGSHVYFICDQIVKAVVEKLEKSSQINSSYTQKVLYNNVKHQLFLFVNCLIENPSFDSQTKETLTTKPLDFGSDCIISPAFLKRVISETPLISRVLHWVKMKEEMTLLQQSRSNRMKRKVIIPKLDDANKAGTVESSKCTLILTEGDSAKALAIAGLSVVGRDYYGVFPLRGKLLNVRDCDLKQIIDNQELSNITNILGLNYGRKYTDEDFQDPKERALDLEYNQNLRYGKVMLMTDQDNDGSHIKGLFLNYIHHFFPALLEKGFVQEFATPIIKATPKVGGQKERQANQIWFYSVPEYEKWKQKVDCENTNKKDFNVSDHWIVKYYKGLGTNTSEEGKEYFRKINQHCKSFVWDDRTSELINMAFSKDKVEDRKNWLQTVYSKDIFLDHAQKAVSITDFINQELIQFSHADLVRSVPSVMDGLKPGQRKVLFACMKKFKNPHQEMKVAQLAGYVAEQTSYHHGEAALHGTIINMAQDFVGSNNYPLLEPLGQFGTRLEGGDDSASPRYIFTRLNRLTRSIFSQEDDPVLSYLNDDGQMIEPKFFVPIFPAVLLNGCSGIGTGWATSIPCYNPLEIIDNVENLINGRAMNPMKPWYRGFKGSIESGTEEGSYLVKGKIERVNDNQLRITELPIKRWTNDYKSFLDDFLVKNTKKQQEGAMKWTIQRYSAQHTEKMIDFRLELGSRSMSQALKGENLYRLFKLSSSIKTSNMHLFDAEGKIKKFSTPLEIIEDFYPIRKDFYEKRKSFQVQQLSEELHELTQKLTFCKLVSDRKVEIVNRSKQSIFEQLLEAGLKPTISGDFDHLMNTPLYSLTKERFEKLSTDTHKKHADLADLESRQPQQLWLQDLMSLREKFASEFQKH